MKKLVSLLVAAFIAAGALASPATDRGDVTGIALSFYRSWSGGDLDGALSLWSPQSPALDAVRRKRRPVRTHCVQLGAITTPGVVVDGDSAVVDVQAEWLDTGMMPGAVPTPDFADGKIVLRRESGRWRIVDWKRAEVELAGALARAGDAERARILANPRLRCRAAVREMARRAVALVNESDLDRAARLVGDADGIATEIGDDAGHALAAASISIVERHRQHLDRSIEIAQRSVRLAEHAGDADALVRALLALGGATVDEKVFERALSLCAT